MSIYLVIWMLFVYWFADFICQDDKTAINKSKSNFYLFKHGILYSGVLLVGFVLFLCISPR